MDDLVVSYEKSLGFSSVNVERVIEIRHRVNSIDEIGDVPRGCGAEVDVRSHVDGTLYLSHDPFQDGDSLLDWLDAWKATDHTKTVVFNVKEEGLEQACEAATLLTGVSDWFFLDQSFPFLVKTYERGENRCAARFSEYESFGTVENLSRKVSWVWVDCFTRKPWFVDRHAALKALGFKTCVVSPELQGETDEALVREFQDACRVVGVDAICTKYLRGTT